MSEAYVTSGKKISKKVRQQYRRDIRKEVKKFIRTHLNAIKKKPRFVPLWWWKWRVNGVIDVEQLRKGGYSAPYDKEEDETEEEDL